MSDPGVILLYHVSLHRGMLSFTDRHKIPNPRAEYFLIKRLGFLVHWSLGGNPPFHEADSDKKIR